MDHGLADPLGGSSAEGLKLSAASPSSTIDVRIAIVLLMRPELREIYSSVFGNNLPIVAAFAERDDAVQRVSERTPVFRWAMDRV
jgi:hypothetical protein